MRLLSARVEFRQIPYTNFETTTSFLSNFCNPLQFHEGLFLCTFLAQTKYTLLKRSPLKIKIFETFECSAQILSNSLCQFWNHELIPLQIFCPSSVSWKIIPLYFFSSSKIYFAQKEPIKMKIFQTFEWSAEILSNSLCYFWNDNLIPLQIL